MALTKITYTDKVALEQQPYVAAANKVQDTDLNTIKTVVNTACDQIDENVESIDTLNDRVTNLETIKTIIDITRPVGSLYISANSTNPNTMWPGTTWVRITDTFIIASGTTYIAGTSYGSSTHTHSGPSHTHTIAGHTHTSAAHSHTNSATGGTAITVDQMPSHTHSQNSHNHTGIYWTGHKPCCLSTLSGTTSGYTTGYSSGTVRPENQYTGSTTASNNNTGGGASHNHSMSSTDSTTPGNTGSTSLTTDASGIGTTGAASSIPTCVAKYVWERTA